MRLSRNVLAQVKLAIVGGGCGGSAIAARFSRVLGSGQVAVIEPQKEHYYQPGFTLVAGGIMQLESLIREEKDVLPSRVKWIQSSVDEFNPSKNQLKLSNGETVDYDFLVIATGIELRFDMIKGLPAALDTKGVCSIYSPKYAQKTFQEIQSFKGGKALFTFPNTPIKCAGAPQKICYLAEDYWRKHGIRGKVDISYNTTLAKIFGIEVYANALMKIINSRGIKLNTRTNLIAVDPERRVATFELLDENGRTVEKEYDLLHVGPPCSPVESLRKAAASEDKLVDANGWVDVDPKTLQSRAYKNVFAIGDCTNTPNAKTAAAIASQFRALKKNLSAVINGKPLTAQYDGYASCPLVVSSNKVILAEFGPNGPMETLPINQARPMIISYWMKKYIMPVLYWKLLVKGYWNGPSTIRKILHLGLTK